MPKEVAPIKVLLPSFNTKGPPESPLQVEVPPVVLMQMFVELTAPMYQGEQPELFMMGTVIYCNMSVAPLASKKI